MRMRRLAKVEGDFSAAFAFLWERAKGELAKNGIVPGALVRNKDGVLFRLTRIEPQVHNFGHHRASISCYGVRFRADGTWGTHLHWVGCVDELLLE